MTERHFTKPNNLLEVLHILDLRCFPRNPQKTIEFQNGTFRKWEF